MVVPVNTLRTLLVLAVAAGAVSCASSNSSGNDVPMPGTATTEATQPGTGGSQGVNVIISGTLLPEIGNIASNLSVLAGKPAPCGLACTRADSTSELWTVVLLRCAKVPPGGFSAGNAAGWSPAYLALDSALARWCRSIEKLASAVAPGSTPEWETTAVQMYDEISKLRDAAGK